MARAKATTTATGPAPGVLSQVAFKAQFDIWLKQHEEAKPFSKLRELQGRIAEGERRIRAALGAGKVTAEDEAYKAAVAKLDGLKAEVAELIRTASVPHFAYATAHNFLRASRGWNLPDGSTLKIDLPGVFFVAVDLSESEVPF